MADLSRWDAGFAAAAIADTALAARDNPRTDRIRRVTKSSLMPVLLAKVGRDAGMERPRVRTRIRTGLALSWAGDVALLGRSDAAFGSGLACFAGAHACYRDAFAAVRQPHPPRSVMPLTVAGLGVGGTLARRAGRLGVPVAGYSGLITSMAVQALSADGDRVGETAARRVAFGAGLFVVSDALIGLRRFAFGSAAPRWRRAVTDAGIMATYAVGQWLIADAACRMTRPASPQLRERGRSSGD